MATGYQGFKDERYANNPVWTQVDEYTATHLHNDKSLADALNAATANSDKHGLPSISVSEHQGKYLMLMARMKGAKHILEVGLLGGYSTIWLANSSPDVKITTVEYSEENARVASENLTNAGVIDRVEVIVGSGTDVLPQLVQEVKDDKRPPFDFFFIDADKQSNWIYVDCACKMASPKACIYTDNAVRRGKLITDPQSASNLGNRTMIENIGKDDRLDATVIQWVGDKSYDGFLVAIVK
jgi:predicted O-methyltransferase YrrM